MRKILDAIKTYIKRPRGLVDGIYIGFGLALLLVTFNQQVLNYFTFTDISKLNEVETILNKVYAEPYTKDELTTGMYKGLVGSLDGFSTYMTTEEYNSFSSDEDSFYCGIGIKWQLFDEYYTIIKVYEGSPAFKAGIEAGDIIWGVNGKNCQALTREELRAELRGEQGTFVDLIIIHNDKEVEYTVERQPIQKPNAILEIRNNIGIITLESFEGFVVEEFHNCIEEVNKQGISNLIIDLRYNTGGSIELLGTIMQDLVPSNEKIFSLHKKDGTDIEYSVKSHTDKDFNIVILVNSSSASCSEIMAGSLRDLGLAILVGENTYGKGVIQDCIELRDHSILYLTSGHYYLPAGEPITEDGLTPDFVVRDIKETFEDEQLIYALNLF